MSEELETPAAAQRGWTEAEWGVARFRRCHRPSLPGVGTSSTGLERLWADAEKVDWVGAGRRRRVTIERWATSATK